MRRIGLTLPSTLPFGATPLLFVMLALLVAPTGCGFATFARVTVNDHIDQEDVTFILLGKTSFGEIVDRLGTPDEMAGTSAGGVAFYHFRDAKYSRINLGWPLRFWLPVTPDLIVAGGGLGTDVFEVAFDRNWIAQQHAFSKHANASRWAWFRRQASNQ